MAKTQAKSEEAAATEQGNGFPVPFPEADFQKDILVTYVHKLRELAWMTGAETKELNIWKFIGRKPEDPIDIYNPDATVEDMGFGWDDIKDTDFARYLLAMYEYGCLGISDRSIERMEDGTVYTWLAAILMDLKKSEFMGEWFSYGGEGESSAHRCHDIMELANARLTLETGAPFSYVLGDDDQLTVRQLALLAGMEEMSIRAAANPNRPNPLPMIEEEKREKRTRFAVDVAKAWLQSKGRHVPIRVQYRGGDVDLAKRKFSNLYDLLDLIEERKRFLANDAERGEQVEKRAAGLAAKYEFEDLEREQLKNLDLVRELAGILEFPEELFVLRVRETLAGSELAAVQRQLRELGLQQAKQ